MKKYVLISERGTWAYKDDKLVIDCTVKEKSIIAQADSPELLYMTLALGQFKRYADGTWQQLDILPRAWAKRQGLQG